MPTILTIATFTAISLIAVIGVYLITGLCGLFSLGQASFMAVGAYVSGVLVVRYGLPFPVAVVCALGAGLLAGLVVGLPSIRLRRDYIALVTFGFGEAVIAVLNNTAGVTGGATGLSGIPRYTSPWLAVVSAVVVVFFAAMYRYSKYGRQCIALKTDELAASCMGIDVGRIKLTAFLLASVLTAYAGVLYGFYTTYVDPSLFDWTRSALWIIIIVFGGLGSLTGAVVAALILGALPELLRFAAEWRIVIYCVIVIVLINFRPKGLFGAHEPSFFKYLRFWKRGDGDDS